MTPISHVTPRGTSEAWLQEVIMTKALRGGGTDVETDFVREVLQVWSTEGTLLAEADPFPFRREGTAP